MDNAGPTVAYETEETITLHGLGFLQVKLQGKQRLHIWHPELPRRSCAEFSSIHDHRFSFMSKILVGTQINRRLFPSKIVPIEDAGETMANAMARGFTHVGYLHEGPRTKFGNRPWLPHLAYAWDNDATEEEAFPAGHWYAMQKYMCHQTVPGGDGRVATIMEKTDEDTAGAHSICLLDRKPDVDFDRKQWPESVLWDVVRDVLGGSAFNTLRAQQTRLVYSGKR